MEKRNIVGDRMHWESGISRCKLLYIELKKKTIIHRINNKVFLCSTGNYNHYPVINPEWKGI